MKQRNSGFLLLAAIGFLAIAGPFAQAVITKPTPLKQVIEYPFIFVATVTKIDPEKSLVVLKVGDNLKGKIGLERMPVNIKGDAEAEKEKQVPQLLKRLDVDLPVMVFCVKKGSAYEGFGYSNGTWFQLTGGVIQKEPLQVNWQFTHFEPYFRRTFKGTTEELQKLLIDGLAGKKELPDYDSQVEPGIGPELKPKDAPKEEKKEGARLTGGPTFAVIPMVAIGGPLAILSMLFPTLFGKPKDVLRRWLALLTVASIISTIYLLHTALGRFLFNSWLGNPILLWLFLALVAIGGWFWARHRFQAALKAGKVDTLQPTRGEEIMFRLLSLSGLILGAYALGEGTLFESPWKEMLLMWAAVWAGTFCLWYVDAVAARLPMIKPAVPLEGIMIAAMAVACVGLGASQVQGTVKTDPKAENFVASADQGPARSLDRIMDKVLWKFAAKDPGALDSTALVAGDRVFVAAAHHIGFTVFGRLYCLDGTTGKEVWQFDDEEDMKQVFSSPCVVGDLLYIGEGFHQDSGCKMFCVDIKTGKKKWEFKTKSHTESSPCVVDGKVYFGAGDDGVYCLNADDGKEAWHWPGLHVDTNPTVVNGKLYGGSAYGDEYWMFCLDAATGAPRWKVQSKLPVFGSATVYGKRVFFGTGNGNMVDDDKKPAGALLCLQADTGEILWRFDQLSNSVLTQPAVDEEHVYFGSRDGSVYCVQRLDGRLRWKTNLQSPVVSSPALGICPRLGDTDAVYAVGTRGRFCALHPDTGALLYEPFEIARDAGGKTTALSSVRVVEMGDGIRRRVYFGVEHEKQGSSGTTAALYCVEDRRRP
jgi:outer membrane protein assembly factor BamB